MSFSKAKIQRFNDVKASIAAGKQIAEKPKVKPKPVVQQPCDIKPEKNTSDTASSQSVPCFRTPNLLKKKLKLTVPPTDTTPKPTTLFPTDPNIEALKEKIVECENKDAYIKDLTQQLEEFKDVICKIQRENEHIQNETEKHQRMVDDLRNSHQLHLQSIQTEFHKKLIETLSIKEKISDQLIALREDFKNFQTFYETNVQDLKNHCTEMPIYFQKYSDHYQILFEQKEAALHHQENIVKMLERSSIEMQKKHSLEIEQLRKEQQIEIQDLEFELLKTMTELQKEKETSSIQIKEMEEIMNNKLLEMREVFQQDKESIIHNSQLKIKEMEETLKSNSNWEDQMNDKLRQLEVEWKNKLNEQQKQSDDILKECQTISEYHIIQCTIEKNAVVSELKENVEEFKRVKNKYEELTNDFKKLTVTYNELKTELKLKEKQTEEIKKKLQAEIEQYSKKLKQTLNEKSAYEYTIKNSQVTIEVLTKRLIHSDKDVEQLKEELSDCEKKLLEYEEKNLQLTADLKQAQVSNEELEMQFESTIKINCKDIENMGSKLNKEVDNYKKEVIKYKQQFTNEQSLNKEIMQQVHDAYDMINRLKMELEDAETIYSQYKFEIQQSQNELEDYHMREMDWNIIKDKLESTVKELEDLLSSKNHEIADLKKKVSLLEQKSDSILHYSDYYKQKVKELELEQVETSKIHKKYIELSGKYDCLSFKYEELESENLQHKMKLVKLSERKDEDDWKVKYDTQVTVCSELEQKNAKLEQELQKRLKDESTSKSEYIKMKVERDALSMKVQQLENEILQFTLNEKPRTPKTSKKFKTEDQDPMKLFKKNKHSKEDKENIGSPNRTLNSSRMDSPLRDRN
ncbi:uncharacterized protein [Diabrotica undecimpunctata]|uniref:uncharacterized protein n=1 Tax=Diabrotica undecimpunctata TaxID=50387 RepID=UPI003B64089E